MGWLAAELSEIDSKYEVAMTSPGYEPKDMLVTATPSEIIVYANVERGKTEEAKCLWTEFGSNDVYRRFALLEDIDVASSQGHPRQGMLHITAAKVPKAKAKAIEVRPPDPNWSA